MVDYPVRLHVDATYQWRNPEIDRISGAISDVILPFLSPDPEFSGSVTRTGPPTVRHEQPSLDSWSAALSPEWDELSCYISKDSRSARINFLVKRGTINVSLSATESAIESDESLKRLLEEFQTALSLELPRSSMQRNKERLEGEYHVKNPDDVRWFEELLRKLESWQGSWEHFNGSLTLAATPQLRQSPADYSDWKNKTTSQWQDIVQSNGSIYGDHREFSVRYHAKSGELFVSVSSHDATELSPIMQTVEQELGLLPSADISGPEPRKGERRLYFASEPINAVWFEQAASLISSIAADAFSFQGRFRTAPAGEDFSRTTFDQWRSDVRAKWDDVISIYCWVSAPGITLTVDIDLLRDFISLDLQAPKDETIQQHTNAFELQLKLIKAGENPYRYRRFLRAFKVKRWTSNDKYAQALREAIEFAFPGRAPGRRIAMPTAFVAVGETAEDLEPFTSYELFLQRVASSQEFTRAEVALEGPRGRTLGVLLNRKANQLSVRTSLERAELDGLTLPFRNALELTLEEAKDEPEKEKPEKPRLTWLMVATTVLSILAAFWSGGVAVFTSQRGLAAFRTQYDLEITNPTGESGKPIELNGQDVRIDWKLLKKDLTGDHPDLYSAASVEVIPDSNPRQVEPHNGNGWVVVTLKPGTYSIKVVSKVDPNSARTVKVKVPEPNSESKPPKAGNPPGNKRSR